LLGQWPCAQTLKLIKELIDGPLQGSTIKRKRSGDQAGALRERQLLLLAKRTAAVFRCWKYGARSHRRN
jgi:hypothetical protein